MQPWAHARQGLSNPPTTPSPRIQPMHVRPSANTNRIVLMLAYQSYIAKRQYPNQSHDQWLFTFSDKTDGQIVDWYIRALESVQPDESE
jgi:hypothetical protein